MAKVIVFYAIASGQDYRTDWFISFARSDAL